MVALGIAGTPGKAWGVEQQMAMDEEKRVEDWIELCEREGKDWRVKLEVKEEEEEERGKSLTEVLDSWVQQRQQPQHTRGAEQRQQHQRDGAEQRVHQLQRRKGIWTVSLKSVELTHVDLEEEREKSLGGVLDCRAPQRQQLQQQRPPQHTRGAEQRQQHQRDGAEPRVQQLQRMKRKWIVSLISMNLIHVDVD